MAAPLQLKDPYSEKRIFVVRVATIGLITTVMLLIVIARYFSLQITQHEAYRTESDRNRVQLQPIPPKRGLIYDRNGVLLAENIPSYRLTIIKEAVDDLDESIGLLSTLVDISEDDIEKFKKRLGRARPFQSVPLKFKLSEEDIATISVNKYRLPGIDVDAELVRRYPLGEYFAHALGYVGRINEQEQARIDPVNYSGTYQIGKSGIEKYYEQLLHGEVGNQNVETNARGRVLRVLERSDPKPGRDIVLHLDAKLQQVTHDALGENRAAAVAIDPKTGGVLAMVSTPSFDANLFVGGISSKDYGRLRDSIDLPLFNRALQGQYPPGSTLKPVYGLAGLHYGIVTPETAVRDPGWYQLPNDDRFYRDWKRQGHAKWVALEQAIVESCDVYYYDLSYKLGIDRIYEFTKPFGLGAPTGVDNTSERRGLLPSREWKLKMKRLPWFPGETLNIGLGQGYMLTTPMQLAMMTAVLATKGDRVQPQFLKSTGGEMVEPVSLGKIEVDDQHWAVVFESMRKVIHSQKGTARKIGRGAKYEMAGKTGTAQVIGIAQGEEYDEELVALRNRDHGLFVGFAPYDDPKIAVAVIVENGGSGSSAAAPIARIMFDSYLLDDQQLAETSP